MIDFSLADIDKLTKSTTALQSCTKHSNYHMEDVHRAGGVMGILGELNRAGLIHNDLPTVHSASLKEGLEKWDVMVTHDEKVNEFYKAGPAGDQRRQLSIKHTMAVCRR